MQTKLSDDTQKIQIVLEASSAAMIMINSVGNILFANKAAEDQLRYSRGELAGKPVESLIPERFRKNHPLQQHKLIAEERLKQTGQKTRLIGLKKNGKEFPLGAEITPIETTNGHCIIVSLSDMTVPTHSEERFKIALDATPSGMLMVDKNARIILINKAMEREFGYQETELIGKNMHMLIPERYHPDSISKIQSFFTHDEHRQMVKRLELCGLKKDGTEFPVEIELTPVDTSDEKYVIASIIDISDHKKSEERFRTALDAAPVGMLMVDVEGKIVLANQLLAAQFGYLKSELTGKKIETLVPQRFRKDHPQYRKNFVSEGTPRPMASGLELYGLKKNGQELPIQIELTPVQTSAGLCTIAAVVDISHIKKAESEIEKRSKEIEQFVYTVSHDLKSPIVTTMGFLEYLQKDLEEGKLDKAMDSLGRIYAAGKKMNALIQDLLHFSRVGYMDLNPETINIDKLVLSIKDQFEESLKTKGISFIIHDCLGEISGDPARICQVFENLIGNAIKYSSEKKAKIEIGRKKIRIKIFSI